jgi:hypothetical protein
VWTARTVEHCSTENRSDKMSCDRLSPATDTVSPRQGQTKLTDRNSVPRLCQDKKRQRIASEVGQFSILECRLSDLSASRHVGTAAILSYKKEAVLKSSI